MILKAIMSSVIVSALLLAFTAPAEAQLDFERLGIKEIQSPVGPAEPNESFERQASLDASQTLPAYHHYLPECNFAYTIEDDTQFSTFYTNHPFMVIPVTPLDIVEEGSPQFVSSIEGTGSSFGAVHSRAFSTTGQWHVYNCNGRLHPVPVGEQVSFVELVAQAWANLDITQPDIKALPQGDSVVNLQTFYSVDPEWFESKVSTVNAGRISVTVEFEPINTVWNSGEPGAQSFACPLYGFVGELRTYSSNGFRCGHTYREASAPGEPFEITVDTIFDVTAEANIEDIAVGGDNLPQMKVRHSRTIEVKELSTSLVNGD